MDSALKQRLLGAAVLIALAVIFLPMFFSSTPPKQENTTLGLNIPPAPERNFETRNLSIDGQGKAAPAPLPAAPAMPAPAVPAVAAADRVTTVTTATADPGKSAAAGSAQTRPASESRPVVAAPLLPPKPAPTPPPAPSVQAEGRFLVGLGVYSDDAHAKALVEKVKKLGYPAFAESTEYQGKPAMRVRVGPYADRAAAEGVRLKIKQAEDKVPSNVVDVGDKAAGAADAAPTPAPAAAPVANRAGGFAVQVAAFKSEEEANKLRDRMRNGGIATFVEKGAVGDQTWWKVRAGPYADRPGAEAAVAGIKQKFQLNGMVTAQP